MCGAACKQVRCRGLATLHGEVGRHAAGDVKTAVGQRVGEAAAAVLRQRQGVDTGDLGHDGIGVVADLLADVRAGAEAHAVVVTEHCRPCRERAGELPVDVDHDDPGLHGLRCDLGQGRAVERQHDNRVDTVVDERLDLADLQVHVVGGLGDNELDVVVLVSLGKGRAGDRAHPAVVGCGG